MATEQPTTRKTYRFPGGYLVLNPAHDYTMLDDVTGQAVSRHQADTVTLIQGARRYNLDWMAISAILYFGTTDPSFLEFSKSCIRDDDVIMPDLENHAF